MNRWIAIVNRIVGNVRQRDSPDANGHRSISRSHSRQTSRRSALQFRSPCARVCKNTDGRTPPARGVHVRWRSVCAHPAPCTYKRRQRGTCTRMLTEAACPEINLGDGDIARARRLPAVDRSRDRWIIDRYTLWASGWVKPARATSENRGTLGAAPPRHALTSANTLLSVCPGIILDCADRHVSDVIMAITGIIAGQARDLDHHWGASRLREAVGFLAKLLLSRKSITADRCW